MFSFMRRKRPTRLSGLNHAHLVEQARIFCRVLNDLSSRVAPTSDDYRAITALNDAARGTVKAVTGHPAPWILPVTGASYPVCHPDDCKLTSEQLPDPHAHADHCEDGQQDQQDEQGNSHFFTSSIICSISALAAGAGMFDAKPSPSVGRRGLAWGQFAGRLFGAWGLAGRHFQNAMAGGPLIAVDLKGSRCFRRQQDQ